MNFAGFSLESGTLCASITLRDGAGRRVMFGWVTEGRTEAAQRASGWSGVMCLPRVLSLGRDGGLCIDPVPELRVLRGAHQRFEGLPVPAGATVELPDVDAACAELAVTFERESEGKIGVMVGPLARRRGADADRLFAVRGPHHARSRGIQRPPGCRWARHAARAAGPGPR